MYNAFIDFSIRKIMKGKTNSVSKDIFLGLTEHDENIIKFYVIRCNYIAKKHLNFFVLNFT